MTKTSDLTATTDRGPRAGMKYLSVEVDDVLTYVTDPEWIMEQKHDGTRGLAVVTADSFAMYANDSILKHSAATQHLPLVWDALRPLQAALVEGDEVVLDGEIMTATGEFRVFDCPFARVQGETFVTPATPFATRRRVLVSFWATILNDVTLVAPVVQADTEAAKAALFLAVEQEGAEGVILKHVEGMYATNGKRSNLVVKVKFVKTADVIVTLVNRPDPKHGNLHFAVQGDDGSLVAVGACSAIGKPHVVVGDVIEVAYLYREAGGSLVQPRMMRVREDKPASACRLDQFRAYSRAAVRA